MTFTELPAPHELTTESFYDWCVANHATEPRFGLGQAPAPAPAAPTGDAADVAPASWDGYIGQPDVCDELQVRIASAKARGAALPPVLLTAAAGAGKTTLARLVAADLGRPLTVLTKPCSGDELARQLDGAGPVSVLFVDEVHLWTGRASHDLMQLIEDGTIVTRGGLRTYAGLSVIAATTDPERLSVPLLSRFGCTPRFRPYAEDAMETMVSAMAYRAGLEDEVTRDFEHVLGRAAAGSPRAARQLVLAARDLALAGRPCDGDAVLTFMDVDLDGLTADHRRLLGVLAATDRGAIGLPTLAHTLGVAQAQVERIERLLIDREYIILTGAGRRITPLGLRRLS